MGVYDETVLEALIASIVAALNGTSLNPNNTIEVEYECDSCWDTYTDWPTQNTASVSSLIQAIYTVETSETNGNVKMQNLEVSFTLAAPGDEFLCSAGAFVLDALAIIGLFIPGFE